MALGGAFLQIKSKGSFPIGTLYMDPQCHEPVERLWMRVSIRISFAGRNDCNIGMHREEKACRRGSLAPMVCDFQNVCLQHYTSPQDFGFRIAFNVACEEHAPARVLCPDDE